MAGPILSRRIQMQFLSSRSKNIISPFSSASNLFSLAISTDGAEVATRAYSQHNSYYRSHNDGMAGTFVWGMTAVVATAGISLLGISSSSLSQTLCESTTVGTSPEEDPEAEPEIDPYDNLPEEDEPTHCSICMTYRQGPCRPYWRKVEACTKDGEKNQTKKDEGVGDEDESNQDGDASSSPMSESTRCFKYMMPWIDCASKYRNLYTLIEMDTNYTEGVLELEATSRHFCWLPGTEPKVDWSNWEQFINEEEEANISPSNETDAAQADSNVALWKTIDPALGDPKLISVEAQVPASINDGLGILECAYALDEDNNVIGFAYGTKPSELMNDENNKAGGEDTNAKAEESSSDVETKTEGKDSDDTNNNSDEKGRNGSKDKMVTLNIRLVESRTKGFVLSASYTHRIEGAKSTTNGKGENNPIGLESHLYKSKPFALADIPKLPTAPKGDQ